MNEMLKNKTLMWILVAIVGLVGMYLWIRWMLKYAPKKSITDDIVVNESELTHDTSQYDLWADQLFNAMNGDGTDEDSIYAVIEQLKSKSDWNQLVKAFGVRELRTMMNLMVDCKGTLGTCLRSELRLSEIERINKHLGKFGVSV